MPAEVVAATQRDRLYDGLVHTVAAKGYANARVSDICQAAGVTRPAFYALFEGKDDAFVATYRHGTGVLLDLMEAAYRDGGDWCSAARAALRVLLEVLASVPAFATMALVEIDAVGPQGRRERDRLLGRFDQFFAEAPAPQWPGEASAPQWPGEVADVVGAVVGGIHATIYRHVAAGRVRELPRLLPVLTYFMMAPFIGPADAAREAGRLAAVDQMVKAPCAGEN